MWICFDMCEIDRLQHRKLCYSLHYSDRQTLEVENPGTLEVENPAAQLFLREVYRQITLCTDTSHCVHITSSQRREV